jgi:oxalate---CoA ligase
MNVMLMVARRNSVHDYLVETARSAPSQTALIVPGGVSLDYGELVAAMDAVGVRLSMLDLTRHDRVALILPPGPDFLTIFLGITTRAVCAPVNPAYRADELRFCLSDVEPRLVIVDDLNGVAGRMAAELGVPAMRADAFETVAVAPTPPDGPAPDDLALVLHTSGTTARPKQVWLTHRQLARSAANIATTLQLTDADRYLNVMPLFHVHGLMATLATLTTGGAVVVPPAFDSRQFASWAARVEPTWYSAAPAIHRAVLARGANAAPCHRLRFIRSGSAPLSPAVAGELERTFSVPVIEFYGMTETTNQIASNPLPPALAKPGSVGLPTGVEVRVVDGEVLVRGDTVIASYGDGQDESAFAGGWLRTGDLGWLDEDGYLFLEGRRKEVINRGGEKISPREIEERLLEHPAVAEAAVYPIANARVGEEPACAIVARPGHSIDPVAIREWLAERIADFKVPRFVRVVDAIPLAPSGKLRRADLASVFGEAPKPSDVAASGEAADEPALTAVWREVLDVPAIGRDDDFFDAGGDSLLAVTLLNRVCETLGVNVSLVRFLDAPTIGGMAAAIGRGRRIGDTSATRSSVVPIQSEGSRPPLFCVPGHDGSLVGFAHLARHLNVDRPVMALPLPPRLPASPDGVRDLATSYADQIRQACPAGPYVLIGMCYGGFVAFEIARALRARRDSVALLALLDCVNRDGDSTAGSPSRAIATAMRKVRFHSANLRATGPRGVVPYLAGRVAALRHKSSGITLRMTGTYDGNVVMFRVPHMRPSSVMMGWSGVMQGAVEIHDVPFHARGPLAEPIAPLVAARLRQHLLSAG